MPEHRTAAGFHEDSGFVGLDQLARQRRHRAAEHRRQVQHGEVAAQQGGHAQDVLCLRAEEAEPVGDGGAQRRRRLAGPLELGLDPWPDREAILPPQRVDQFADIQRVSGGTAGELPQPWPGRRPGQPGDKLDGSLGGQRSQVQHHRVPGIQCPPQPAKLRPFRHRPARSQQQQRQLRDKTAQPRPHREAGFVRPLEVVDDEYQRRLGTEPVHQAEQPFRRAEHRGGGRPGQAAVPRIDHAPLLVGRGLGEAVEHDAQGKPRAVLVREPPAHPAAERIGAGQRGREQRRFADSRFTVN